jgi:hypothetical protein
MSDPIRSGDDATGPKRGPAPRSAPPKTPRWVKVSAIIVGALLLLAVIVKLTGAGDHGPGRHTGADVTPSAGVVAAYASSGGFATAVGNHR